MIVEQLQREGDGFRADAAGFEIEDEGLPGAGGEGKFSVRTGFFEDTPDADGERRERRGCAGFRSSGRGDLGEVVEGEFEFVALAGGVDGADVDGCARAGSVGGDFDAGFVGFGGIGGEDFGGEFGVREFEGGEFAEVFAEEFYFGGCAALEGGRFEAGEDGLAGGGGFDLGGFGDGFVVGFFGGLGEEGGGICGDEAAEGAGRDEGGIRFGGWF